MTSNFTVTFPSSSSSVGRAQSWTRPTPTGTLARLGGRPCRSRPSASRHEAAGSGPSCTSPRRSQRHKRKCTGLSTSLDTSQHNNATTIAFQAMECRNEKSFLVSLKCHLNFHVFNHFALKFADFIPCNINLFGFISNL